MSTNIKTLAQMILERFASPLFEEPIRALAKALNNPELSEFQKTHLGSPHVKTQIFEDTLSVAKAVSLSAELEQALKNPDLSQLQKAHLGSPHVKTQIFECTLSITEAITRTAPDQITPASIYATDWSHPSYLELIKLGVSPKEADSKQALTILDLITICEIPIHEVLVLMPIQQRAIAEYSLSLEQVKNPLFPQVLEKINYPSNLRVYVLAQLLKHNTLEQLAPLNPIQLEAMYDSQCKLPLERVVDPLFLQLLGNVNYNIYNLRALLEHNPLEKLLPLNHIQLKAMLLYTLPLKQVADPLFCQLSGKFNDDLATLARWLKHETLEDIELRLSHEIPPHELTPDQQKGMNLYNLSLETVLNPLFPKVLEKIKHNRNMDSRDMNKLGLYVLANLLKRNTLEQLEPLDDVQLEAMYQCDFSLKKVTHRLFHELLKKFGQNLSALYAEEGRAQCPEYLPILTKIGGDRAIATATLLSEWLHETSEDITLEPVSETKHSISPILFSAGAAHATASINDTPATNDTSAAEAESATNPEPPPTNRGYSYCLLL